ncbi:MAG: TolB family protein, partial [Planctomycetota bacterium]
MAIRHPAVASLRGTVSILLPALLWCSWSGARERKSGGKGSAKGATLGVQSTKPLKIETFTKKGRINTNGKHVLFSLPKILQGLQYTSHEHGNAGTIHLTARSSGRIYLCLAGSLTPEARNLDGAWDVAGKVQGTASFGSIRWAVYEADINAGEKWKIESADKWGCIVAAAQIGEGGGGGGGGQSGKGSAVPKDVSSSVAAEYSYLEGLLRKGRPGAALTSQAFRKDSLILASDRDPLDVVLRRTGALLANLTGMRDSTTLAAPARAARSESGVLAAAAERLAELRKECAEAPAGDGKRRGLFAEVCKLRRKIAFANPLLDFDKIVFLERLKARYNHMCDQYFGFHAARGGGLFVLDDPFGAKPTVRDLLANSVCRNGRLKGKKLDQGSFISLDLSYDGRTLLFAYTEAEPSKYKWSEKSTFHIFKVNVDGSGLTQLTDGKWNDFDPCWLPNGRIVFISERRGGFGRCHGRPVPTYTLHSMKADGSDIITLSYHETNEWHPSVDNNGMIVYTRWDYVDRDSDVAHHIWQCYPDGRDARAFHGNYPVRRESRPWMEMSIRAIPRTRKYVSTAAPHHGQAYGSLVMIDQRPGDDNAMSQVKRLTPEVLMPESESAPGRPHGKGRHSPRAEVYGSPWPLSEDYYLCVYDPKQKNYGIYLMD